MQRLGLVLISLFMLGSLLTAPTASQAGQVIMVNENKTNCYYYEIKSIALGLLFKAQYLVRPRTSALFDDLVGSLYEITCSNGPASRCADAKKESYFIIWHNHQGPSMTRSLRIRATESGGVFVDVTRE